MAIENTDLLYVQRPEGDDAGAYKIEYEDLKTSVIDGIDVGGASVHVGEDPPADPEEGDLWWDSSDDSGRLYVWYEDGSTNQWVETSPSGVVDKFWMEEGGALKPTNSANNVEIGSNLTLNADGRVITQRSFQAHDTSDGTLKFVQIEAVPFDGGNKIYGYWDGTQYTSSITPDGDIIAGTGVGVGNLGCHLSGSTGTLQINSGADNFNSIIVGVNGQTEFSIKGNGDVYIGGNVVGTNTSDPNIFMDASAGTIRAANVSFSLDDGSTFAVKDRILNLISRLDAIEANEQIDDATDTSLLQLVANASTRLDSIEARLSALEGGNN